MSFGNLVLTNKGKALMAKVTGGQTLSFTAIKMGTGSITSQSPAAMTDLISTMIRLPIASLIRGDTYTTISSNFKNTNIKDTFTGTGSKTAFKLSSVPAALTTVTVGGAETTAYSYANGTITFTTAPASQAAIVVTYSLEGFHWREIGLFATDPDEGEVMFSYQNAYSLAEYIAAASSELVEKVVSASYAFSQSTTVTATIDASLVFATMSQVTALVNTKANKSIYEAYTMLAADWSSDSFSFETDYPKASYDIEIAASDQMTAAELKAFNKAMVTGSTTTNVIKALGTVPTIDIPVIIRKVAK